MNDRGSPEKERRNDLGHIDGTGHIGRADYEERSKYRKDAGKIESGSCDNENRDESGEEKTSLGKEILSWVIPVVVAVILAVIVKNYVIINATVPTSSMMDTIQKGDDLLGFRLAYQFLDPKRGDVIIFNAPDEPGIKYIKRVIGLPGEKLIIRKGKIYINDSETPLQEDYLKEEWTVLNDGMEFHVPEGHYLMLGDNRNNSKDARYWKNTYLSRDAIIAKAMFVYYPFKDVKKL